VTSNPISGCKCCGERAQSAQKSKSFRRTLAFALSLALSHCAHCNIELKITTCLPLEVPGAACRRSVSLRCARDAKHKRALDDALIMMIYFTAAKKNYRDRGMNNAKRSRTSFPSNATPLVLTPRAECIFHWQDKNIIIFPPRTDKNDGQF
jgi:hypothetical protein